MNIHPKQKGAAPLPATETAINMGSNFLDKLPTEILQEILKYFTHSDSIAERAGSWAKLRRVNSRFLENVDYLLLTRIGINFKAGYVAFTHPPLVAQNMWQPRKIAGCLRLGVFDGSKNIEDSNTVFVGDGQFEDHGEQFSSSSLPLFKLYGFDCERKWGMRRPCVSSSIKGIGTLAMTPGTQSFTVSVTLPKVKLILLWLSQEDWRPHHPYQVSCPSSPSQEHKTSVSNYRKGWGQLRDEKDMMDGGMLDEYSRWLCWKCDSAQPLASSEHGECSEVDWTRSSARERLLRQWFDDTARRRKEQGLEVFDDDAVFACLIRGPIRS